MQTHEITINRKRALKRVFYFLLVVEILMALADVFLNHYGWIESDAIQRAFNITREDSIQNWFSSMQAMLVSLSAFVLVLLLRAEGLAKKSKQVMGWLAISFIFLFISIDDGAKLHERLGTAFGGEIVDSFFTYNWYLVVGPLFLAFGIYLWWFLKKNLVDRNAFKWVLTAIVLFGIAIGLDFLEGIDSIKFFDTHNNEHFLKVIEEFLEMLATTFFLVAFLAEFTVRSNHLSILVDSSTLNAKPKIKNVEIIT